MEELNVWKRWQEMGLRLAVGFPNWVINRLKNRSEGMGLAIKLIPIVIVVLSFASIYNLADRAQAHHAGFSSFLTGAGIAVLVPIAILATMLVEGNWRYAFWGMGITFAFISGSIQFMVYSSEDSSWFGLLEAISFGYGVPFSEVMLAVMESQLYMQALRRKDRLEQETQKRQVAEQERLVVEQERLREQARHHREQEEEYVRQRQRQEQLDKLEAERKAAEVHAYEQSLQLSLELRKAKALLKLGISDRSLIVGNSQKDSHTSDYSQTTDKPLTAIEAQILEYIRNNRPTSQKQIVENLKISQSTVTRAVRVLRERKLYPQ